jgi:hypothetical protein
MAIGASETSSIIPAEQLSRRTEAFQKNPESSTGQDVKKDLADPSVLTEKHVELYPVLANSI